jgi:DNA repair exonuclease SbcCD nuclease subunit
MVRFIHTSDWHLGMRRHFLNEEAEHRYRQDRIDAVRRIGEVAAAEACDFIVASGDLLDSNQIDRGTLARAVEAMRDLPVPVYLLPGNHDAADASSVLCGSVFRGRVPPHVHVLDRPGIVEAAPGVEIVAAPWRTRRPLTDLVREACGELKPGPLRIVVGHGAVDRLSPDPNDPALVELALAEAALAAGCVHYVALGDRHSTTRVGDSDRIWYCGTPEPTAFDEESTGNVLVVALDRESVAVRQHRVGRWNFQRVAFSFTGNEELDRFADTLDAFPNRERTVLRLALSGTLSLNGSARLEVVLEEAAHVFAGIAASKGRSDLTIIAEDADFADLQLAGFASAALGDLRAAAGGEGDRATAARDALGLLLRLAGRAA